MSGTSGETEDQVSGWTVDTLHAHVQTQFNDMRKLLDERYATQTKAVDAAFLAQQTAMQTALTAAERAVQTALLAAEKAVAKAEAAADKRFESVNEFRQQLADQATLFFTRTEADARLNALGEKVEAFGGRNAERIGALERAMERGTGHDAGSADRENNLRLNMGQIVGALGLLLLAASVGIALFATR